MCKILLRCMVILSLAVALAPSAVSAQSGATIRGTIRYQGAPVEGAFVIAVWDGGVAELSTGPDGGYRADGIPAGGWVMVFVRPRVEMRLAYRNWRTENLTGEQVKDFDLQPGYLLRGQVVMPDGNPPKDAFWLGMHGTSPIPESEWLGETVIPERGTFEVVLPPDVYRLETPGDWRDIALPDIAIDLTGGDVVDLVIAAQERAQTGAVIPIAPPRADLIQVSASDTVGYATITGLAGAVPPNAAVFIGNVNSHVFATANADPEGGFSAQLYAPPGSYVLVKYGTGERAEWIQWVVDQARNGVPGGDEINELPGTMLQVSGEPLGGHQFTSAGAFSYGQDTKLWAGWWFSGSLQGGAEHEGYGVSVQRGQQVTLTGTLRVTSPAIVCDGVPPDIGLMAHAHLHSLFDAKGNANPWGVWFTSTLFTPTGLPIEHEGGGEGFGVGSQSFSPPVCAGEHSLDALLALKFDIPPDMPDGIYLPFIFLPPPSEAIASNDMQQMVVWYDADPQIKLPPLVVGDVAAPRIPWVLLGNYLSNGHRGVTAREDQGQFAMPTRVVTPPQQVVLPRLDARTGQPIAYQLEPGSPWLSQTDRRQPNPPYVPLALPSGELMIQVQKPDGSVDTLGPARIRQSSVRTPSTPGGSPIDHGTGHIGDLFHLATMDEAFAYRFEQYGAHVISISGAVNDVFGNTYPITGTYDVTVARILDLDPAQLPSTPYMQGDAFAPGLHVYPPVPADVTITVTHLTNSDPNQAMTKTFTGRANRFGYFQPPIGDDFIFETPGEFRVDYSASYRHPDGTLWAGAMTWGNVVEGTAARIEAHGRRGMDYKEDRIDDMPAWFEVHNLPENKIGIEMYYPYFSGDIHWGSSEPGPGDSIHSIITVKDTTPDQMIYNILRQYAPRARVDFRWPPVVLDANRMTALDQRIAIGEAPLFITTSSGNDAAAHPEQIDLWGYWYGSSERPDVRVREIISEDGMGTAYWRFDDTYGYQIGESAEGDLPGDLKWEFGGAVLRVPGQDINEYAIYSSLWVLLPPGDPVGARVTPPFQDATGASINGGPIMTLNGEDIDMLFLPKSIRPGDLLTVGDVVAFSGHVGPPLDSRVTVTITAPSGATYNREWHANKIGWLYDPTFNFAANEAGRWTVDVQVLHDRPYVGNGVIPQSHNTGTVLGTAGQYEFYVVPADAPRLDILVPLSGIITWPGNRIEPITFEGVAPAGTTTIHYTVHDKGVVMEQGTVTPYPGGTFVITYDARLLHEAFPFLSLTAHEGLWEGLSDEVTITMLAVGGEIVTGNTITLIGEELFVGSHDIG